ncbi:sulfotransferase domain-containing protein [Thalassococcus sp. BH17M4-6]|uniref:sulfotransferase domain-containing protein n=1 Tax=Thalassococcus sp. BH17M4-6 TaxID=3413148 RepID=UPI003BEAE695
MTIPNLFIVGAPKCGTTAWVRYLSDHPEIYFSPAKEPHFFCTDFPNYRWAKTLPEYEALFAQADCEKVVGEASVNYLYSKVAAQNINEYNPQAKILVFLRDHGDFLLSYHNQLLYNRDETITDFRTIWSSARDGKNRHIPKTCREPAFLDYAAVGRFAEQLERYIALFPSTNIKIVHFSDWIENPRPTYVSIIQFLGLEDDGRDCFEQIHSAKRHKSAVFANLTQRPPKSLLLASAVIKRLLGRKRLGLAKVLRYLNAEAGYASRPNNVLRDEIRSAFAKDRLKLREMTERLQ